MTTSPAPSGRGPVPGHVAWVARQPGGGPVTPEREERALLALVEAALGLGVAWLTVQDPSEGRALRERAAELARRGVAVAVPVAAAGGAPEAPPRGAPEVADGSGTSRDGAAGPRDLVPLERPALRVLLAPEGSGRRQLLVAARELAARGVALGKVSESTLASAQAVPDVDLLVLTGDDHRVPDLLIWQVAYSEIVVLPDPWPGDGDQQFRAAVDEYQRRNRRYGGLVASR